MSVPSEKTAFFISSLFGRVNGTYLPNHNRQNLQIRRGFGLSVHPEKVRADLFFATKLQSGITLIELFVVIGVIGLLLGLLLPAAQSAREAARRTQCSNTVRQSLLATHSAESRTKSLPEFLFLEDPRLIHSAKTEVSTFEGIANEFSGINHAEGYLNGAEGKATSVRSFSNLLRCPSAPTSLLFSKIPDGFADSQLINVGGVPTVDYAFNGGYLSTSGQDFDGTAICRFKHLRGPMKIGDVSKGTSNILHVWESVGAEAFGNGRSSYGPTNEFFSIALSLAIGKSEHVSALTRDSSSVYSWTAIGPRIGHLSGESDLINSQNMTFGPFSMHPGGCIVGRLDGSVSFLDNSTSNTVLIELVKSNSTK